jgi:hypothetical protein
MKKVTFWIVLVVVVMFIGKYAHDRYQQYQFERAVGQQLEQMIGELNRIMVEQDTLCTINSETSECTCILQSTGAQVLKTEEECVALASKASDDKNSTPD